MASEGPCVLDATVLSNFASTDSIGWLVQVIDRPVAVHAVRDELETGRAYGHEFLRPALEAIGTEVELVEVRAADDLGSLHDRLDPGEADSVRAAVEGHGTLASDDKVARAVAREHDVAVTGSVGLRPRN